MTENLTWVEIQSYKLDRSLENFISWAYDFDVRLPHASYTAVRLARRADEKTAPAPWPPHHHGALTQPHSAPGTV